MSNEKINKAGKRKAARGPSTEQKPTLFKLSEAAVMLNVAPRSLYTWIRQGRIRAIAISRGKRKATWRISEAALKEFIENRERETASMLERALDPPE